MLSSLLLCLYLGATLGFVVDKESPPEFSEVYSMRGVLSLPYAELKEPFYIWFDSKKGRSRIDYYGGMDKTYQFSASAYPPYGAQYKLVPTTNEDHMNMASCLQSNGTKEETVGISTLLPDTTGFKFVGKEEFQGMTTYKWLSVETVGEVVNKYFLWVTYKTMLRGDTVAVPVRYEVKGFNKVLGSHYDHYIYDYSDYDVEDIDDSVFKVDTETACTSLEGPPSRNHEFVNPHDEKHVHSEFERFKLKHKKQYSTKFEHTKRLNIFRQNLKFIHSTNRARLGFSVAVNHLADLTNEEMRHMKGWMTGGYREPGLQFPYSETLISELSVKLPPEHDWRLFGAVTSVKDQATCGSCWSFGTVGAVEGALFMKNGGHLVRLSQQALVDCSWGFGNNGCDGGLDTNSYQWIKKHGLPTEDDYGGYLGQDGYCHSDNVTMATSIKGYVEVTKNNENALRLALFKHGPISVAIDASQASFRFYSHGVYYEPKCKNTEDGLDHAVLAVGYGVLNGKKYWLVKNSWSNHWGNDGYILMSSRDNNCGVGTAPTYVTI